MSKHLVLLDDRELATVLAALDYWRQDITDDNELGVHPHTSNTATNNFTVRPLDEFDIDKLRDRISSHEDKVHIIVRVEGGLAQDVRSSIEKVDCDVLDVDDERILDPEEIAAQDALQDEFDNLPFEIR